MRAFRISPEVLSDAVAQQRVELERRENLYRGSREAVSIEGKTVILIDDGIATGSTVNAAIEAPSSCPGCGSGGRPSISDMKWRRWA
ncbi:MULTISPECIES: phosphoribosyltransferase family protein [unclassified Caballeronia]|uniref:phosphoribosyltransferase family protein n=1 Tax=unclassified Caballeronia TaxID=2646786 RepID=UPI0020286B37